MMQHPGTRHAHGKGAPELERVYLEGDPPDRPIDALIQTAVELRASPPRGRPSWDAARTSPRPRDAHAIEDLLRPPGSTMW